MLPISHPGKVQRVAAAAARGVGNRRAARKARSSQHVAERAVRCRVSAEDAEAAVATDVPAQSSSKIALSELKVGDVYDGEVVSVASYGAFVNIGAATDGLVHVSQLSWGYVKAVEDVVKKGEKVKVKVLEVDGKRISLTMKIGDPPTQEERQGGERQGKRAPRRGRTQVQHNLKVGDEVTGVVSRVVGFGGFIKMEDGFEVLLPVSQLKTNDELDPNPRDYLKVDQKVTGTIVKVDGQKVSMTNLSEEDRKAAAVLESGITAGQGTESKLSGSLLMNLNALDLGSLASKSDGETKPAKDEKPAAPAPAADAPPAADAALVEEAAPIADQLEAETPVKEESSPAADAAVAEVAAPAMEPPAAEPAPVAEPASAGAPEQPAAPAEQDANVATDTAPIADHLLVEQAASEAAPGANPVSAANEAPTEALATEEPAAPEAPASAPAAPEPEPAAAPKAAASGSISAKDVKALRDSTGAGMMDCKKALTECSGSIEEAKEWLRKKGMASAGKKAGRVAAEGAIASYIHAGSRLGVLVEVNCETDFVARGDRFKEFASDVSMQLAANGEVKVIRAEDVPADLIERERAIELGKDDLSSKPENIREKIVEGRLAKMCSAQALMSQPFIKSEAGDTMDQVLKALVAELGEKIEVRRFVRYELGEGLQKKEEDFAAEVAAQTAKSEEPAPVEKKEEPKAPEAEAPKVQVDAKLVKQLRESSGAGMMDCKKALAQNNNDLEAASEFLRKKGLASAGKKAGRVAAEGVVACYIHAGSSLGVLLELNCETDFVAKGERFKELADDLAMQVAACSDADFVSMDDIPESVKAAELAAEMQKEDLLAKPENIREKIASGRVQKTMAAKCLLEQPFIKDTAKTTEMVVKEAIAALGENIKVRRFERFVLGEGIEKKADDFAAEVAAQTGQA